MSDVDVRATATAELLLEPQVRQFADRRWLAAGIAIPLLILVSYAAVLRLAALERMLVADVAHVSRAVLYEVPKGSALVAPIEPRTEILRLAMHAYVRDGDLALGKRKTILHVVAEGTRGRRIEDVTVDVPGQRARVTSDEPGLEIGDPVGIDFDVREIGAGELTVHIADIDGAAGLLVRMYRREALSPAQGAARERVLDTARKNHMARWSWELGWDEASSFEQREILDDRWRRVGALRGAGHDLRSIAVALAPRATETRTPHVDDDLGSVTLRGDERVAFVTHGPATIRVTSDLAATLTAVVRDLSGAARTARAPGALTITTENTDEGVEVAADRDVLINVRTTDAAHVDWYGFSPSWRATVATPVIVESPESDRVVRVTARRPVDRAESKEYAVDATVVVTAPSLTEPRRRTMHAERARSRFDRYEAFDPTEAPTERFTFYVAIPRGGQAVISPEGAEAIDLSLAELDSTEGPEPIRGRAVDEPPPAFDIVGEVTWHGFSTRRPSNADAFDGPHRTTVRVARHVGASEPATPSPTLARFVVPRGPTKDDDGRRFFPLAHVLKGEVGGDRPALLPFRLIGEPKTTVELRLASGSRTPRAGAFYRMTLPRTVAIGAGPTRGTLVVGDDIPAGTVTLTMDAHPPDDANAATSPVPWVHVPRAAPHAGSLPARWIAGQFEE